ncbi:hypothetical protein FACS189472_17560 [Alphaproteobacteria bacterium]|nr:hypothetical protein FACS189472_17560 [Alphaproteobacteria bacterium]
MSIETEEEITETEPEGTTTDPESPHTISIDLGTKNLAYALFSSEDKLISFHLVDTKIDKKTASDRCDYVHKFARAYPTIRKVIIEKQLPVNVVCFSLMYAFIAAYKGFAAETCSEIKIILTPPWKKFQNLGLPCNTKKKSHKKLMVETVQKYLSDCLLEDFKTYKKQDDIADSIMQYLSLLPEVNRIKENSENRGRSTSPVENEITEDRWLVV